MRALEWISSRIKRCLAPKERTVKRYSLPRANVRTTENASVGSKTADDVVVRLDELVLSVRRRIDVDVPFEVSVVVPRVEVTETYAEGKLVQRTHVYSSITIAHSPRSECPDGSSSRNLAPSNDSRSNQRRVSGGDHPSLRCLPA